MEINKVLPYFIIEVNSEKEFITTQNFLFKKGYQWINMKNIITFDVMLDYLQWTYPLYLSNLQFCEDEEIKNNFKIREEYQKFDNSIFFIANEKEHFDLKMLRREKLLKLNQ